MTITAQESDALDQRSDFTANEIRVVDSTMDHLHAEAIRQGVPAASDDRLAKVEAAVNRYIIDSR